MSRPTHTPVLSEQVMAALRLHADDLVVDATYGGGGHARAILAKLGGGGRLLAIDRDPDAIARARLDLEGDARVEIIHAPFSHLGAILAARGLSGRVAAMLFDFGVSSPQLDQARRGFSFSASGPLDMRMDPSRGASAAQWLEQVDERELCAALRDFGEERFARRIARAIKQSLARDALRSTTDLADVVAAAAPSREVGKHPATRTFQAIRIAVNDELGEVREVLPQALDGLAPRGRLVMISFHSLEDRLVKRFFRAQSKGDPYPPELPVSEDMKRPRLRLVGKPVRADAREIAANRRARSAVMRVAEKIGDAPDIVATVTAGRMQSCA
ncbi:MAG: 16S rRNA (cytosine(1402)-N(4))-methyltransferase RsmH [bacterium]